MKSRLVELYQSIDKDIKVVYVFPDIETSSRANPYLKLFYQEFLSGQTDGNTIRCISPHPLFPQFIIKKLLGEKNIVHYHWIKAPDIKGVLILCWKMGILLLYNLLGGKIVWSVHNKEPHEKKYRSIINFFRMLIARRASKIHVHSQEAAGIMAPFLNVPVEKFFIINHPLYPAKSIDRASALNYIQNTMHIALDPLARPVFLIYGQIAPYKGITDIIKIFLKNDYQLIIAGKCEKNEYNYLRNIETLIKNKKSIHLRHSFLSKEEEQYLFNAVDCTLFNFQDILTSGSVILSISYRKDVIVPNSGCLKDLSGEGVYKFNTQEDFEHQINNYIQLFLSKNK